ncbi:EamA family transporter [Pendulispora brunnea]|uniref:EamA family transporter n=1 Tax=Pendulispora brunnea TaxID=2905690 RepID=A0ABZ2JWJ5_9BACT
MKTRATRLGCAAIGLWATLAWLSTSARRLPPFQLLAMTFAVATALGLVRMARAGGPEAWKKAFRQPLRVWLVGVGGLFGFHAFYFVALAKAPAVHVSLIAYLWPLLIVILSGARSVRALAGAAMGLGGVVVLLVTDQRFHAEIRPEHAAGYLSALACACTWAGYSVANRRFVTVPVDTVTGFCLVTAVLGGVVHAATETTLVPTPHEIASAIALGLGPVGAAFFLWDYGTKHGDLPLLGVLSYATPLLSTLLLIVSGAARFSWNIALACLFIAGGAWLASSNASKDARRRSAPRSAGQSTRDAAARP